LIFAAREEISRVQISEAIGKYIVELVFATRYPMRYSKQLGVMIDVGVSPRGSLALTKCAQVHAWMRGRPEVTAKDVQSVIHDVFRHRILKSEHTKFSGIHNDKIIDIIVEQVPDPTPKRPARPSEVNKREPKPSEINRV
jgi:MoxR-like ATPase